MFNFFGILVIAWYILVLENMASYCSMNSINLPSLDFAKFDNRWLLKVDLDLRCFSPPSRARYTFERNWAYIKRKWFLFWEIRVYLIDTVYNSNFYISRSPYLQVTFIFPKTPLDTNVFATRSRNSVSSSASNEDITIIDL